MRATTGITVGYVILVAALMMYGSEAGSRVSGVFLGEIFFSSPMLAGWLVARMIKRPNSRSIMLVFLIGYALVSALTYYGILTGEHDAQWQLSFFLIPMAGFAAVVIFGAVAFMWRRSANPSQ